MVAMSQSNLVVLILCGGSGTRLWPLSRQGLPKQFAPIITGKNLFERSIERNVFPASQIMIAVNQDQASLAFDQMKALGVLGSRGPFGLIEAIGRNTAAAIALSAMLVHPDDTLMVVPADHIIANTDAYHRAVSRAVELAESGYIVTFGIRPEYPETGYGYIEAIKPIHPDIDRLGTNNSNNIIDTDHYKVASFREKPDKEHAKQYFENGNYYWNSGMFCFKAGLFLEELGIHAQEVYDACRKVFEYCKGSIARENKTTWQPLRSFMETIPAISVDYAVMEHSERITVLPCEIGWSDLGSLESLRMYYQQHLRKDIHTKRENATNKGGNIEEQLLESDTVLNLDSSNNLSISDINARVKPIAIESHRNMLLSNKKQIILIDVDDLMIVETSDALLISKYGSGQKVKHAVAQLKKKPT